MVDDGGHRGHLSPGLAVADGDQLHLGIRVVDAREPLVPIVVHRSHRRIRAQPRQLDRGNAVQVHHVESARIAPDVAERPGRMGRIHVRVRRPLGGGEVRAHFHAIGPRVAGGIDDDV